MIKDISKKEMAEKIATGISSGLWGSYNTVRSSEQNGFPVIGIGCWVGETADRILNDIGNGHKYMDTSYYALSSDDQLNDLICLLQSDESHLIQDKYLKEDTDRYVSRLTHHDHLTNPDCIIYAGLWCAPDTEKVVYFVKGIPEEVDKNDLEQLNDYFINHFSVNSHVVRNSGEIELLGKQFYHYVTSL